MAEPYNKFVEVIKIWQYGFSAYPVAIILYDSNGGIEVQLGRKIWGNRDHFKVITSEAEIVEIQRKRKTGFEIVSGGHVITKRRKYYE